MDEKGVAYDEQAYEAYQQQLAAQKKASKGVIEERVFTEMVKESKTLWKDSLSSIGVPLLRCV